VNSRRCSKLFEFAAFRLFHYTRLTGSTVYQEKTWGGRGGQADAKALLDVELAAGFVSGRADGRADETGQHAGAVVTTDINLPRCCSNTAGPHQNKLPLNLEKFTKVFRDAKPSLS
jgi:hypothetical protein